MATVDSIKVLAYQKEYTKMNDKYISKPVFVAGSGYYSIVAANDTGNEATDSYSYAEGSNTQATCSNAHAEGSHTLASGYASHAEGNNTVAEGESSHAEGVATYAYGLESHAEGYETLSKGSASHAEGSDTLALQSSSHTEGGVTLAAGSCSHSEGASSASYGSYSHAEGTGTRKTLTLTGGDRTYSFTGVTATSLKKGMVIYEPNSRWTSEISTIDATNNSITLVMTLGTLTSQECRCYYHCANGTGSHVEGSNNIANGVYAHAEGNGNVASSSCSHAEGQGNTASGVRSHAEGSYTVASGQDSHAEGSYTIASGANQHVAGRYNVEDLNNTYAEIIGIGTAESSRKNGRTLDWSGNEQLAGSLTLGVGTTDETTITAAQLKKIANPTFITSTKSNNVETLNKTYNEITAALSTGNFIPVCSGMYVTYITGHGYSPSAGKRYIQTADGKWWYCDGGGQYPSYSSSAT